MTISAISTLSSTAAVVLLSRCLIYSAILNANLVALVQSFTAGTCQLDGVFFNDGADIRDSGNGTISVGGCHAAMNG
jgi:hypothetical protein